jgi:chemotaxis protein histidine kinase CheA
MGKTNLSDYKNIYLQTAREYIANMSSSCLKLSTNSQDKETINVILISSHSLKSQSQVMGFMNITALSGAIEKKSRDILTETTKVDDKFIFFLKNSIEKLNLEIAKI